MSRRYDDDFNPFEKDPDFDRGLSTLRGRLRGDDVPPLHDLPRRPCDCRSERGCLACNWRGFVYVDEPAKEGPKD